MAIVASPGAAALGFGFYLDLALAWPAHEKALELLQGISCRAKQMYADIVADPPDPGLLRHRPRS